MTAHRNERELFRGLCSHLVFQLLLCKFILDNERYEKTYSHACRNDEPEINVVLGANVEKGITQGTKTYANEYASPAESASLYGETFLAYSLQSKPFLFSAPFASPQDYHGVCDYSASASLIFASNSARLSSLVPWTA